MWRRCDSTGSPLRITLGSAIEPGAGALRDGVHVLVAATGKVDQQQLLMRETRREFRRVRKCVRSLQCRNDPLDAAAIGECGERLVVSHRDVLRPPAVFEPRVLRSNAGIVKPRRYRMRLDDLSVRILQEISAIAVQHTGPSCRERGRVTAGVDAFSGGLDTDQLHVLIRYIGMKNPHGVGAAPDAGDDGIRLAARELW